MLPLAGPVLVVGLGVGAPRVTGAFFGVAETLARLAALAALLALATELALAALVVRCLGTVGVRNVVLTARFGETPSALLRVLTVLVLAALVVRLRTPVVAAAVL